MDGEVHVGEMVGKRLEERREVEKEAGDKKQKRKNRRNRRRKGGSGGWSFWRWCKKGNQPHTAEEKKGRERRI